MYVYNPLSPPHPVNRNNCKLALRQSNAAPVHPFLHEIHTRTEAAKKVLITVNNQYHDADSGKAETQSHKNSTSAYNGEPRRCEMCGDPAPSGICADCVERLR